ncbi:hypothetical protein GBN63_13605 [Pectobacterium carotovorum]|nr:hypothetical protein GBN63_13605 [Pectobacterium carotovorum]
MTIAFSTWPIIVSSSKTVGSSLMKVILFSHGVDLVVLTEREFRFSLLISHLLAKAIPVRGAKFRKSRLRKLSGIFAIYHLIEYVHVKNIPVRVNPALHCRPPAGEPAHH